MKFDIAVPEGSLKRRLWQFMRRVTSESPALESSDESREDLLAHLIDHPDDSRAWYELADRLASRGEYGWSFLAASEASRLEPEWRKPVWLSAECLARSGLVETAVRLVEDRGWIDHSDAESVYLVARLAVRGRDPEIALPRLDEVLSLDANHAEALDSRMKMLRYAGKEQACAEFVTQLESRATPNALRTLAKDRIAGRDPMAALRYLEKAPDDSETETLRARALLTMGRYSEAIAQARAALAQEPSNSTASRWLSEAASQRRVTQLVPVPLSWKPRDVSTKDHRVLHLVSTSLPDVQAGYTIRSQAIGEVSRQVGWDAHFLTPPGFGRAEVEEVDGVVYHRLSPDSPPEANPDVQVERFAREAQAVVEHLRPSVIHAHSGFTNGAAALALGEAFDVPVVYEVRGFLEDTWVANEPWGSPEADRYVWRREAETRCMELADAVVTLGDAMKDEIVERGLPSGKVFVVPNAVDPRQFQPLERDADLAARLGLDPTAITLGYVSSLRRLEGIDLLIEALNGLAERGTRAQVLLVGDGPERVALEALTASLGVDRRVKFAGMVDRTSVTHHYSLIDIFVVPRPRGRVSELVTPMKPLEAMAMERPLVVSDLPALREMIQDDQTGLVFRPGDLDSLVSVLDQLIGDADTRHRLGNDARQWVLDHRSWGRIGSHYDHLYTALSEESHA